MTDTYKSKRNRLYFYLRVHEIMTWAKPALVLKIFLPGFAEYRKWEIEHLDPFIAIW